MLALIEHGFMTGAGDDPCWLQPCQNHGVCMPTDSGFECLCTLRYVGDRCQHDLGSLCERPEHACLNEGTCREIPSGNRTVCLCRENFTGNDTSSVYSISIILYTSLEHCKSVESVS